MDFEWDRRKAQHNWRKHRVTFEEAHTVFRDPLARIFDDPDHSTEERRELIIGHSKRGRLVVVSFNGTVNKLRIIPHESQRREKDLNMKKKSATRKTKDEMRAEYQFDYAQARPNRFAQLISQDALSVVLEPDVAQVFNSSESVNRLLRSVIAAVAARGSRSENGKRRNSR